MATVPRSVPSPSAATQQARAVELSIVIPLFNEEESVPHLYAQLVAALDAIGRTYELILVDDGSTDGTFGKLAAIAERDPHLRLLRLRRNFGQTAAMVAGFDHARGGVVIPMDGDLQNDPGDIPLLLQKIDEGFDVVGGWRKNRQDKTLLRKVPSRIANWIIGRVTGVKLHDYGCSLKAYRVEVLRGTRLYGEMHRFIPALANLMGAKICEVPLRHHPRRYGRSKYGIKRTVKVVLDLLTVKFLTDYSTKPIYFFGGIGLFLCTGGVAAGIETIWEKVAHGTFVHNNPFILMAVFLFSLGVAFIFIGLLAEIIIRTYHESQAKPIYWIGESRNVGKDE
jgi:glycosyltransferase involved in cell wall biosynthesis